MHPALLEPWPITAEAMELVISVATRDEFFAEVRERALQARSGEPLSNAHRVDTRDGVAVIPVRGPLFRHANVLAEVSGATSYATLRKDLQVAVEDRSVHSIVLEIDSPGGEANGVAELADAIRAARDVKPVIAYVGGTGASAAYWLASAASEIVAAETAMLGSIGVVIALTDDGEAQRKAGKRRIEIVSAQSPLKRIDPTSEADLARVQAKATALAAVFVRHVARNRGVSAEHVAQRFGQGDVMLGEAAVEVGLADRIGNLEGLLAELSAASPYHTIGVTMQTSETQTPIAAAAVPVLDAGSAFLTDVQAATGTDSPEAALGKIRAAMEALDELPRVRQELAKVQAEGVRRDLRAVLETGLDSRRLTLGRIKTTVPLFVADDARRAAMTAALDAVANWTRGAVVDAVCSVDLDASTLARIASYARHADAAVADAAPEPERDAAAESAELSEVERRIAAQAAATRAELDKQTARSR